jgi:hypothetical protein
MPKYRVQLKQGSKTIVEHIEAKSLDAVLTFYQAFSTAKVTEVLKVEYEDVTNPPIDDMNYYPIGKFMVLNKSSKKSRQIIIHNIKKTKSSDEIQNAIKQYFEIDGLAINNCYSGLIKS